MRKSLAAILFVPLALGFCAQRAAAESGIDEHFCVGAVDHLSPADARVAEYAMFLDMTADPIPQTTPTTSAKPPHRKHHLRNIIIIIVAVGVILPLVLATADR